GGKTTPEELSTLPVRFVQALTQTNKIKARRIEERCRILFPTAFGLFNV
ncbi:hypothetical protein Hamer_G031724, partial [Homarus americanus]